MPVERFIIRGDLAAATFLPWVARHLLRLGLRGETQRSDALCVEMLVEGPADLIDAMEMGVSLGPIEAWVETIERLPLNRCGSA
ncbi:acylphosphatase [Paragemmobacter straminiformis]|uniref:Acylphosphatase n=1 Tax=Paragemmobacter straminiformis TaxID=2045119 RepID=A0A842ICU5_9RHOB|nr:acylphosphatase [Gemmobacter straminiformis]MBC2837465.1 acylphosphatase [Gemmobacter straminiformis]